MKKKCAQEDPQNSKLKKLTQKMCEEKNVKREWQIRNFKKEAWKEI